MSSLTKKIWIVIGVVFVILLVLAMALPLQSNVYDQITFNSNADALNRQMVKDSLWKNWWPGNVEMSGDKMTLRCSGFTFKRRQIFLNRVEFDVLTDSFTALATLTAVAEANGKVVLSLQSVIDLEHNPMKRIKALLLSDKLKSTFHEIIEKQSAYFSSVKNLYDVNIQETTVQFEFYATLTKNFSTPPTVAQQYAMIDDVRKYVQKHNANEKGAPMLNVTQIGNNEFYTQVAIPTDVQLPAQGEVKSKWMLKGGHILKAEVKGGPQLIANAKVQMHNYILDNHKNQVAIPFEALITNRLEQRDSSKWVTEIYFPVYL
jgi:hypothetical protein